jgi:hypothetical protein
MCKNEETEKAANAQQKAVDIQTDRQIENRFDNKIKEYLVIAYVLIKMYFTLSL